MKTLHLPTILKSELCSYSQETLTPSSITYHSQEVIPNSLFICKGAHFKTEYLQEALEKGTWGYLSEIDYGLSDNKIIVNDIRKSMALLADAFYDSPQNHFKLIGITGTKGKSSTTYFIKAILDLHAKKTHQAGCGIISSIETFDGIIQEESRLTTPESLVLWKHFKNASQSHLPFVCMEVSSQGLKYDRVYQLQFDTGIFLNISPDHISDIEHPTFEDYFHSKLKLLSQSNHLVINLDSDQIDTIHSAIPLDIPVDTISLTNPQATYYAHHIENQGSTLSFMVNELPITLGISGLFNIENALAAIATAKHYGIADETIQEALKTIRIPGRMELFTSQDQQIKVIVDYAHNTLSFEKLFESCLSLYPQHQLVILFGCPGNKAQNRRQDLAKVADHYADKIYLCMEDPGYENPTSISQDIAQYIHHTPYKIIDDRKEALADAIAESHQPTVFLFTGKGDETRQKIGSQYIPTQSDISITIELLERYNQTHQNAKKQS